MSDRTPATDKGTADRIEADNGGYWVRLVTKQALRREGACMGNCLDSRGYGQETAGEEEMVSNGLWSLRKADGLSHMLAHVHIERGDAFVGSAAGPKNNQPSGWCCRQLRHLVAAFREAGTTLRILDPIAVTDTDGMTWRPDKAPGALRARGVAEERNDGDFHYLFRNDPVFRLTHRQGRVSPLREMQANIQQGIVIQAEACEEFGSGEIVERLTVRLVGTPEDPPREEQVLIPNGDGTYTFRQTGPGILREFPRVRVSDRVLTAPEWGAITLDLHLSTVHRFSRPVYAVPRRDADGFFRTRIGEYGDGYMAPPARAYLVPEAPGGFVQHRAVPPVRLP